MKPIKLTAAAIAVACIAWLAGWFMALNYYRAKSHSMEHMRAAFVDPELAGRWTLMEGWAVGSYATEQEATNAKAKIIQMEAR